MLRMKQVQTDDLQTWIISMQDTQTGHQQVFPSLDGLIRFLETEFGSTPEQTDTSKPSADQTNSTIIL